MNKKKCARKLELEINKIKKEVEDEADSLSKVNESDNTPEIRDRVVKQLEKTLQQMELLQELYRSLREIHGNDFEVIPSLEEEQKYFDQ